MMDLKHAKKFSYSELDDETKNLVYDLFKRYCVRKQIADQNTELSRIFSARFGNNPREFSNSYNEFNSAFLNTRLISELSYDEIQTDFLARMSEEGFNNYLARARSFDRQMALIAFSGRKSERIANRVDFPVMVAYANMQSYVINEAKKYPRKPLGSIFDDAASVVRSEFFKEHGYRINQSQILPEREDYKRHARHGAKLWQEMMQQCMDYLDTLGVSSKVAYIAENFIFTKKVFDEYNDTLNSALSKAEANLNCQRQSAMETVEMFPDSYDLHDFEEVMYSKNYEEDLIREELQKVLYSVFEEYLKDPIYDQVGPNGPATPTTHPKTKI